MSNKWEDFNVWLDKNIILEQLFDCSKASYIKGVLIITNKDLKEIIDQRKDWQISILVKESLKLIIKRSIFKIKEDNEPKVNLRHLAYYTLLWIICVNDECKMHKAPKEKNHKYSVRMYWIPSELKYRNADYMYRWHLAEKQQVGVIIIKLGRFLIEECLNR